MLVVPASRRPAFAASMHVQSSHGQPLSRAHFSTSRGAPFAFAISAQVCSFHGHPFCLAQARRQGLTLVHFSAQLEPCLTQETTLHTLNTP
jgi:hypothetical protein